MASNRLLTETERATITNCLQVAAEVFQDHVNDLRKPDPSKTPTPHDYQAQERLARQFSLQHSDALAIAELIECAETIELSGVEVR